TGAKLAEDSLKTNIQVAKLVYEYLKRNSDFNFSRHNFGTFQVLGEAHVRQVYQNFIHSIKHFLESLGQDRSSTLPRNLSRIKTLITFFCESHGVPLGDLLKDLKGRSVEKDVITLSSDQVEYVIRNYQTMKSHCV